MNATTMSRIIAALSAMTLLAACNDSFSPAPSDPSLQGLTVVPRSATLQAGQVVALKARLIDEHGDRLDGFVVSWRSNNDAVATVACGSAGYRTSPASCSSMNRRYGLSWLKDWMR